MNVVSEFFGLSTENSDSQLRTLKADLAECYQKIARLQSAISSYEHTDPVTEQSVQDFIYRTCNRTYPGLVLSIHTNTPPVVLDFRTSYTSFFYSDENGDFLYADSPMHSFGLRLTRNGIISVENIQMDYLKNLTAYKDVNTANSFIYYTSQHTIGGHPHCLHSDEERSVNSAWCFGNNTGVDDLLAKACSMTDISLLFRKLYHWLTEINVRSMYHGNVFPIYLQNHSNVDDDAANFGRRVHNTYKECFGEAIQYFKANKNYEAWDKDMLAPVHRALEDEYGNINGSSFFRDFLHNMLTSLSHLPEYKLTWALCLYQFVTACVLLEKAHNLRTVIKNAIEADLFYIPYVWTEVLFHRFNHVINDGTLNYRDAFLHYFDGFDYALKGV